MSAVLKTVVPLILVPVFSAGLMLAGTCMAWDEPTKTRSDRVVWWCIAGVAVFGTLGTIWTFRYFRRQLPGWNLLGLGRMAWMILFGFTWLAGVACGVFVFGDL
jgi:hypothetical protein